MGYLILIITGILCLAFPDLSGAGNADYSLAFLGGLISALVKPVVGLGKTVAKRLADPKRDIFGRRKTASTPDPIAEGLRKTITVASRNIQDSTQRSTSAILSNVGLAPVPSPKTNIALIVGAGVILLLLLRK